MGNTISAWINEHLGEWQADFTDKYGQSLLPLMEAPLTIVRWVLIYVLPFVAGAIGEDLVVNVFKGNLFIDQDPIQVFVSLIRSYWSIIPLLVLISIGLLWRSTVRYNRTQSELLYYSLQWFYNDMGFDKDPEADIRCTLWIPISKKHAKEPLKLKQVTNYIPLVSKMPDNSYYRNKRLGRVYKVSRIDGERERPKGLLGYSAIETIRTGHPEIYVEKLQEEVDFKSRMIRTWNFTEEQASRLTQDRRSYMCLSMMDSGQTRILGIIYCDSRNPEALNKEVGERAQVYLPRIAQLITV